jgi:hypothetical protein
VEALEGRLEERVAKVRGEVMQRVEATLKGFEVSFEFDRRSLMSRMKLLQTRLDVMTGAKRAKGGGGES